MRYKAGKGGDANSLLQFVGSAGTQSESASVASICRREGNNRIFSLSGSSLFCGAIICSFHEFPVFKRHLSFLWGGLVQNKGFPLLTSIHCSQKGHLIMAMGQLVSETVQARPLLRAKRTAKRSCKVYNFPCFFNIRFSRVCPLSLFFQPPSISCYHGE